MCLPLFVAHAAFSPKLLSQQSGVVTGVVTGANKTPVADAKVRIVGTDLAAVTRADGGFHVAHVPPGHQTLEVRMVGYAPTLMAVDLVAGGTINLSLVLEPLALETVKVTADANFSPGVGAFDERRGRGNGHFFTREDIEKMQARQLTDILRRVPGMRIQSGSGSFGATQTAQTGRSISSSGSRTCPMAYYVNGTPFPLTNDQAINHFFSPDDVVAMEVYMGASQTPAVFNSTLGTARCGVVVVWTRNGVDARVAR